ncbi:DUF2336 domain-containing protein [Brucella sp. BO3]|uniref:DUF2336 domain-containing protein n=1 Tax=Brucella sp. BO3 TaxID=2691913 RepID=UPI0015F6559E|nr:DUF2336 domain-containing protein [Brucella sp. BO3]QMV25900.1 DUF2336 domain-containing protein [Brucella sp. BO3]
MAVSVCLPEYLCVTNDQFRVLEEISGNRSPSSSKTGSSKADDLLAAALSAFATIMRPGRQDMQQLEDLAMPLLQCASTRGKRHAANALAHLEEAPRRLVLALANEPVEISAPLLLRSPLLRPSDLVDIIARNGIAHARAIARRQSDDVLLRGVLRSFADAAIDRTLALQENLANIDAEPLEKPEIPDLSVASGPLMRENHSERLVRALQQPFFTAGTLPGCEHLIDTALLIDSQLFRTALADALDISFDRADAIIGKWPDSYLPIALKALGLSAPECYLVMTAVLGSIETTRDGLRDFVHIYRSIDRAKAMSLVRRWKSDDMSAMLRNKLREMAVSAENEPLDDAANTDAPKPTRSVK